MTKTELFLMRRTKKIKLREIADHLKCSESLISKWERNKCNMESNKVKKYEMFIISYRVNSELNQLYEKGR